MHSVDPNSEYDVTKAERLTAGARSVLDGLERLLEAADTP